MRMQKKVAIKDSEVIHLSWTVETRSRTRAVEIQQKSHKVTDKPCLNSLNPGMHAG